MSACPDDNQLVAYAAGRLSAQETRTLELHFDGCEVCRTLAAEALQEDAFASEGATDAEVGSRELGAGAVLGRYVVLAPLGAGGMGTVLSAYDPKLERKVAVKLLHPEARTSESSRGAQARLLKEAQAMARLAHPNVVSVFDVGTWRDRVFIAMEFVDGGTLRRWCAEPGRTQKEILRALLQAGRGLEAAHKAGLVHRDFKPDNVLVSRDGRVLVTDFGLAHAHTDAAPSSEDPGLAALYGDARLASLASTQTGALVGTPAYMAPEQFIRRLADAQSDQFAFCATAWEALTGHRPFELEELTQLAASLAITEANVSQGLSPSGRSGPGVPVLPPEVRLPAYVHRALLKGLRPSAEQRHTDLSTLLTLLAADPASRRWTRLSVMGLSLALVIGLGAWTWQWSEARALRCSGSASLVSGSWNEERRQTLRSRLFEADVANAETLFQRIGSLLTKRADGWTDMHREACEATRIREEQSEEVLSLRMVCLDRRLKDFDALVRLLLVADAQTLGKAAEAVEKLPPLEVCADVASLMAPVPMPSDPDQVAAVEQLSERLSDVRARFLTGRYREGIDEAQAVWTAAQEVQHAPTRAEASTLLGMFLMRLGRNAEASDALSSAVLDSDRGRDDLRRAEAAIADVYTQLQWERPEVAEAHWKVAEAALERLGTPTPVWADLALAKGRLESARGESESAFASYRDAAARYKVSYGETSHQRSAALGNMASELRRLGRSREAAELLDEALTIRELNVGDDHPSLIAQLRLRAFLHSESGQHDAALKDIDRAEALVKKYYPSSSRHWTWMFDYKATIHQAAGDYTQALAAYRASWDLKQQHLPEESYDFYFSYDGVGQCLLALNRPAEALPHLERAWAVVGDDPGHVGDSNFALARVLTALRRDPERVRTLLDVAHDAYGRAKKPAQQEKLESWRKSQGIASVATAR